MKLNLDESSAVMAAFLLTTTAAKYSFQYIKEFQYPYCFETDEKDLLRLKALLEDYPNVVKNLFAIIAPQKRLLSALEEGLKKYK